MTRPLGQFKDRISSIAHKKQSRVILALDFNQEYKIGNKSEKKGATLEQAAVNLIEQVQASICAIKINFHLLLPLSSSQISSINRVAHSHGLVSIADIKLNDIEQTNEVALQLLVRSMDFDCVIANPFIGSKALQSLVNKAHSLGAGVIALVYMSHPGAAEGYGLDILQEHQERRLYDIFLERAISANADGIVVGATQKAILADIVSRGDNHPPIYSPGVGAQGATVEEAVKYGSDFLIIGRSIVESENPGEAAQEIQSKIQRLAAVKKTR